MLALQLMNITNVLSKLLRKHNMAQIKLELKKEIYIPYKVIIKMEEEVYPDNSNNKYAWQEEENYYQGQHWKLNSHNYN